MLSLSIPLYSVSLMIARSETKCVLDNIISNNKISILLTKCIYFVSNKQRYKTHTMKNIKILCL